MTICLKCKKSIELTKEPKLKFTRLGTDYFHADCYIHIHNITSLVSYT